MSAELDPDSGYHIFRVKAIPSDWMLHMSMILGDIAHNCRSALDQLYWQLVIHHGGRPKKPGGKTRINYSVKFDPQRLANLDTFKKPPPGDQAMIDEAQPYKSWRGCKLATLSVLEQLSNRDKHRVFNPLYVSTAFITVEGSELEGRGVFDIDYEVFREAESLKVGIEIVRCKVAPDIDAKVEVAGYAAPDIKLPQWNSRLTAGTTEIIRTVEDLVHEFELRYGV
jgi:hypothetical protein